MISFCGKTGGRRKDFQRKILGKLRKLGTKRKTIPLKKKKTSDEGRMSGFGNPSRMGSP